MRGSPLARILFVLYAALAVYASLYPLEGWRAHGLSAFAYLDAPWPRYVTAFDLAANVLGYVPYGFLFVAALYPALRAGSAFTAALASAAALSVLLEAAQSYLPTRVATNLDVLCNLAGAALGAALGVAAVPRLLAEGPLRTLRARTFLPGALGDWGLALLGLWLFSQLNPAALLFATGDLRDLLAAGERAYRPQIFVAVEAATAAANLVSVGMLLSVLALVPARKLFASLVLAAIVVKTAAFAIIFKAENVLVWLTPGAQLGLAAGCAGALLLMGMPRTARLATAAVLIMAATVLLNLAPANPYLAASLKLWQQGHFLNFNGLTRLVSALWAFAALGYLIFLAARRREPNG
jgi:VanZ family protein